MKTFLLAAALLGVSLQTAHATTSYYVSTSGNDANPGSKAKPWRTVQKACNSATPNSVVSVTSGTYNEKITVNVQGTSAGSITLQGAPGAIISGAGKSGQSLITIQNKSYLKIIGFELQDDTKVTDGSAIRLEGGGSHIELRKNKIHDILGKNAMGITVYGTSSATPFSDLIIDGNEIYNCQPAPSEALTLNGNVNGFEITNNYVHDVNNIGIDMIGGEGTCPSAANDAVHSGVCRLNRVERSRSSYGGGYGAGIYVDGGRDIVVERNSVTLSDLGIEIGCENHGKVTSGITVRDNLITKNDKAGLVFGGYDNSAGKVQNCRFLNNTLYQNDTLHAGNGELWIQIGSGNVVQNNLFISSAGSNLSTVVSGGTTNTINYNLWFASDNQPLFNWKDKEYTDFSTYQKASKQDAQSIYANPQLSSASAGNFRLKNNSPAINSGDPKFTAGEGEVDYREQVRVQGGRVDLGAFESSVKATAINPSTVSS